MDIQSLPIYAVRQEIMSALPGGRVVITAPTGSGKSTQVPKFVLEALPANERVLVLQPRRLAARMLAERVASEMGCKLGALVGFQTRYEKAISAESRIVFITEGILTRMLVAEPSLPGVGAVIFDEFHERSLNTDLGLAMAWHSRQTLRPDLKLLVMSATMDARPVCAYLDNAPEIKSDGRLYDVEITYCNRERQQLGPARAAAQALAELLDSGAEGDVLVFMPGGYEIRKTIEACSRLRGAEKLEILPLYGDLPPSEQRKVMEPSAKRKVIVATNIAETSLTIPGVRHVIDSGYARINRYDPIRGVDSLDTVPIARDSADQRAGRAGREGPGTCRRLWTWIDHSAKNSRTLPEIQRVDLADAVLAVSAFGYNRPAEFPWFEAPPQKMLEGAVTMLEELGYLKPQVGGLTELGQKLHAFPAHPRLTLLMWMGAENGCFQLCAWAAAILSERALVTAGSSPKAVSRDRRYAAKKKAKEEKLLPSDFLSYIDFARDARSQHFDADYCRTLGVNPGAARDICRAAEDYCSLGRHYGWEKDNADNPEENLLKCLLRAFPDRLARRRDEGTLVCFLPNGKRGELSAESVVRSEPLFIAGEIREVAGSGVQSSKLVLSLASAIREDWLLDFFPDAWEDVDEVFWDDAKQQVMRRRALNCLGLCLEEKIRNDADPEKAADILAAQIFNGEITKPNLPKWDADVERWIERVNWVASVFPEEHLPVYDAAGIQKVLHFICEGEYSIRALKNKECLPFVKQLLSYEQQQFVDKMAPAFLHFPNGHRMKIEYAVGQAPKGRGKIQDFYDVKESPVIAAGRVKILFDILAPNFRTVQITDDLANFWNVLYPKIRTELARRYPKHKWI